MARRISQFMPGASGVNINNRGKKGGREGEEQVTRKGRKTGTKGLFAPVGITTGRWLHGHRGNRPYVRISCERASESRGAGASS